MYLADLRDLELRHLMALRAVAEERSFGRAAERLGYTQSAISQQIAGLEKVVGEPLFHRPGGPRRVELTPAGRLMLEHAEAVIERLRQAEADLAGYRNGSSGRLDVGTYQSVSVKVLPAIVGQLRAERPDLDIRPFESDDEDLLLRRLAEGDLDLTFVTSPGERDGIEVVRMCEDPYVVVSPTGTDGLGDVVTSEDLSSLPLVGNRVGDYCQMVIESSLRGIGVEARVVFRSGDNAAIQAMVRAGSGHAVMPLLAVETSDPGVRVRPLQPPIPPRVIAIARVEGRPLSPAAERFIEVAREVFDRVHDPAVLARLAVASGG